LEGFVFFLKNARFGGLTPSKGGAYRRNHGLISAAKREELWGFFEIGGERSEGKKGKGSQYFPKDGSWKYV